MIDLYVTKEKDLPCVLQSIELYETQGLVQLGWAKILRDEGLPSGALREYSLRAYVNLESGKRPDDVGHEVCLYDWYVLTVEPSSTGRYGCYEVVIGEGPNLAALLSEGYLSAFSFKQPEWWDWNTGLLGKGFKKWLKKHNQTIA